MKNGNSKWQDSEATDLSQTNSYETFLDLVKKGRPLPDYKRI